METLMITFHNASSPDREEEMNNWYNWVHIRDIAGMPGAINAVQRLAADSVQPSSPDQTYKYVTLYEVVDKATCTAGHQAVMGSRKLLISTAFDVSNFTEAYWDIIAQTASFATYADYKGDKAALTVRLTGAVEDVLDDAVLAELAGKPGFVAAHLLRLSDEQQPNSGRDREAATHLLIGQLDDSCLAAESWDAFAAERGLSAFAPLPTIFKPVIDRFKASQAQKSPEWQALTYLSHAIIGVSPDAQAFPTRG
ncbi:MAG: hypothetical protein LBE08_11695 [Bifidobacteriaceae bacterium]|jgi:hypothetical protein|nr:hypothetical protein [Bifidobacteriaceae bacterium]